MKNPLKSATAGHLGLLLGRLPLGGFFLLAGINKFTTMGVKNFVDANTKNLPSFPPHPIGQTYLYAVPFLEVIVGSLLVLGLFTRTTATVAALMVVSFIIGYTGAFTNGDWRQPSFNLVFIGLALLLITSGAGKISLDRAFFGADDGFGR